MKIELVQVSLVAMLILGGCAASTTDAQIQAPSDCVVDDGPQDPTFLQFRKDLLDIVKNTNAIELLRHVRTNIELGHDERPGVDEFIRDYKPYDPRSYLWRELDQILRLGGRFVAPDVFCAPFFSCPRPQSGPSSWFVLGNDVPAHSGPSSTTSVLVRLSCTVANAEDRELGPTPSATSEWVPIVVPPGRWAYVERRFVRSPADLRAQFRRIQGKWYLVALLASD